MKIYSHSDRFMVWQVKGVLENAGIPCFLKNEFAVGAIGELSPLDAQPEVWLTDNEWENKAKQLISKMEEAPTAMAWLCSHCGEENEGSFEICWQCQADPS